MAIHFEHSLQVSADPAKTFAMLDDVKRTPEWLSRCTGIEKLDPGPNAVGTKLKYSYKQGRRGGAMTGEIAARTPGEQIKFHYLDKMFDVTIDFRLAKADAGTQLTQAIDIAPRSFMGKLLSPLIKRMLPKQTVTDLEKLRELLKN
jgi:carbon monoxide dehydrogenase subunit G